VSGLVPELGVIDGVEAVVLAGSHARGRAREGSDVDLGLYYLDSAPFEIAAIRALAERVNDAPDPVVTDRYEWGPWVNGGAWLTIHGERVDLIYRSLEHVERVIGDAEQGRYERHWGQQPPFGFFGPTYLGEVSVAVPLFDPRGRLAPLRERVASYPEPLRRAVVQDCLWAVEFGLAGFARKLAARGDVFGTVGCLTRFCHQLVLVLFALNRVYPLNDKTALDEVDEFPVVPRNFRSRVEMLLSAPGHTRDELEAAVAALTALFRETLELAGELYRPHPLP
jgi:hypothetical protein